MAKKKGDQDVLLAIENQGEGEGANASAGHALGQIVGDWFQDYFAQPLLFEVADKLRLYLDHRVRVRPARSAKILWKDEEQNAVDYDFVMELDGSDAEQGIPVAFFECFWRRGSRHSKDKARDDSGKLMPMRDTYPTARFLGIVASGDFTGPARTLVQSRQIDLFLVTKQKMIEAFAAFNIKIDYPDRTPEEEKALLVEAVKTALLEEGIRQRIAQKLRELITEPVLKGYTTRVLGSLAALPQRLGFTVRSSPSRKSSKMSTTLNNSFGRRSLLSTTRRSGCCTPTKLRTVMDSSFLVRSIALKSCGS